MGCHSKLDLESYQLGVLLGSQQHEMLNQVQHDTARQGGFLTGLMAGCNDRSVSSGKRGGLISHIALMSSRPNALSPLAKTAFTMAGGGQAAPIFGLMARRIAFTMAEILLSLTIIGVVAAITLPSLTGNINERTWNTQRKALFSRMSQAISLMPNIRGYGNISLDEGDIDYDYDNFYSSDNATEAFLTAGLSKVLKLNNICDAEHMSDCGLPAKVNVFGGTSNLDLYSHKYMTSIYSLAMEGKCGLSVAIQTKAAAFETANGESILTYYNPFCEPDVGKDWMSPLSMMCVNFIYDLNGKKGPNTMGKDMGFMSVISASDSAVVAPMPVKTDSSSTMTRSAANNYCRSIDDARLPNRDELISMSFNYMFMGNDFGAGIGYWSGSTYGGHTSDSRYWQNKYWNGGGMDGGSNRALFGGTWYTSDTKLVRCVKRN